MCLLSSKRIWKTHTHTYTLSLSQKVLYSLLKLGRNYLSSSGIYHLRNKHSISQLLEKQVSGAYIGELVYIALKTAADEGLFGDEFAEMMKPEEKQHVRL